MPLYLSVPLQFVEVEGQITSLVDLYPSFLRKGYRREVFIAIICCISYVLGLTMVTKVTTQWKVNTKESTSNHGQSTFRALRISVIIRKLENSQTLMCCESQKQYSNRNESLCSISPHVHYTH